MKYYIKQNIGSNRKLSNKMQRKSNRFVKQKKWNPIQTASGTLLKHLILLIPPARTIRIRIRYLQITTPMAPWGLPSLLCDSWENQDVFQCQNAKCALGSSQRNCLHNHLCETCGENISFSLT